MRYLSAIKKTLKDYNRCTIYNRINSWFISFPDNPGLLAMVDGSSPEDSERLCGNLEFSLRPIRSRTVGPFALKLMPI
jgi:hypothetical protein